MLNEDKIRLMNETARFAKKEEKMMKPAQRYFRGDYLAKHLLQSFFAFTISFAMLFAVWSLYSLERLLNTVDVMEAVRYTEKAGGGYFAGLLVFEAVTVIVYTRKYAASERLREEHLMKLNRLKKRYEIQDKIRELAKEGGRNA